MLSLEYHSRKNNKEKKLNPENNISPNIDDKLLRKLCNLGLYSILQFSSVESTKEIKNSCNQKYFKTSSGTAQGENPEKVSSPLTAKFFYWKGDSDNQVINIPSKKKLLETSNWIASFKHRKMKMKCIQINFVTYDLQGNSKKEFISSLSVPRVHEVLDSRYIKSFALLTSM